METSRTIFSKPNAADYQDLFKLHSDEEVRKYLGGTVTKDEFDKKFKDFSTAELPEAYWVVREKETKSFIGLVCITRHHDQKHFEVSYELSPHFWSKGYGTEVVQQAIVYAFDELGLDELYAETQKKNTNSVRILEKTGMQFVSEIERFGEQQVIYSKKNKHTT